MQQVQRFYRRLTFMRLKIIFDDKSFHCLKRCIPPGSRSKLLFDEAVGFKCFGSNTLISCDEAEARNLLIYAGHCPGAVSSIQKALVSAGLSVDYFTPDRSVPIQPRRR
jgi:hypothetical protein